MGSWNITVDKTNKTFTVVSKGYMTDADCVAYGADLRKSVALINPAEYHFIGNNSKVIVQTSDSDDTVMANIEYLKSLGFKKYTLIVGENALIKKQLLRLIRAVGTDGIDFEVI